MSKHTGIYCPSIDRQGIDSLIINEQKKAMFLARSTSISGEYQTLMARKPRMQQMGYAKAAPEHHTQPCGSTPATSLPSNRNSSVNLQTTLCALFHALVDDDTVLLEGQ